MLFTKETAIAKLATITVSYFPVFISQKNNYKSHKIPWWTTYGTVNCLQKMGIFHSNFWRYFLIFIEQHWTLNAHNSIQLDCQRGMSLGY